MHLITMVSSLNLSCIDLMTKMLMVYECLQYTWIVLRLFQAIDAHSG